MQKSEKREEKIKKKLFSFALSAFYTIFAMLKSRNNL